MISDIKSEAKDCIPVCEVSHVFRTEFDTHRRLPAARLDAFHLTKLGFNFTVHLGLVLIIVGECTVDLGKTEVRATGGRDAKAALKYLMR
jgi:hypothetical protein